MKGLVQRLLPHSLLGQMLLVLVAGLVVSNTIGWWLYSSDREAAVREVGGLATAQRIANLARLVQDAPPEWRERIVAAASDQNFRLELAATRPSIAAGDDPTPLARAIKAYLADQLDLDAARQPEIAAAEAADWPAGYGPGRGPGRGMGWGRYMNMMGQGPADGYGGRPMMGMMHRTPLVGLEVAVPLSSGEWLLASTSLPGASPIFSRQLIVSMLAMAVVIIGVSIWAARRVTAPLAALADAAQRLGRDVNAPPIAETGTIETRQASHAFNEMQSRLRETIDNRTRLLAAISHDLRTPLTLLRLRAENIPDGDDRDKILATLSEMEAMVGMTLQYARDDMSSEPVRTTDLTALIASIVDDMADAGFEVTLTPAPPMLLACRPSALKRAIRNLADNAVKYGRQAHLVATDSPAGIEIVIEDQGPGLPNEELTRVFQPFYRLEGSRSSETGGVGLGLAIARSLIERHRGSVTLENRPEGGLRARINLPK